MTELGRGLLPEPRSGGGAAAALPSVWVGLPRLTVLVEAFCVDLKSADGREDVERDVAITWLEPVAALEC